MLLRMARVLLLTEWSSKHIDIYLVRVMSWQITGHGKPVLMMWLVKVADIARRVGTDLVGPSPNISSFECDAIR
jgi:hypothetical protein